MHRRTNALLASFSVTAEQFVLLGVLFRQDGITQQEISTRATSDPNTVRAMLLLMEKNGLVERRPHKTDRRALEVLLTDKGRRIYIDILDRLKPLHLIMRESFCPDEMDALTSLLARLAQIMSSPAENTSAVVVS
ncbi:MAG: MarR family winged helix-turn-helix transcriptional regulator [Phycisphaerae bacterium]